MSSSLSDRSSFSNREKALEDAFFHKVDAELLSKLRSQMRAGQELAELAAASGIRDQQLLQELIDLGITAENLLVLWLVPLTQVAWADGSIDGNERKAVEEAMAEQGFAADSPAWKLLESWLDHPPSENVLEAWREYAVTLIQHTNPDQRVQLKHELLGRARDVARAAGGVFNLGSVSKAEEAVLRQIEDVVAR
ncbi:MAG: hypothetical protein ACYTGL_01135 [Planctomycetota bacterium]|jgi:hypothetical protein